MKILLKTEYLALPDDLNPILWILQFRLILENINHFFLRKLHVKICKEFCIKIILIHSIMYLFYKSTFIIIKNDRQYVDTVYECKTISLGRV